MKIPEQWTFKCEEVAKGFDDHVREQLPWYDIATRIIAFECEHLIES
jgi:tRNA (cmo5U34)-methyltransferase